MSLALLVSSALAATTEGDAGIPAELTTLLAGADSIDRVTASGSSIAFSIASNGEAYRVTATLRGRELVGVALDDIGPRADEAPGAFTWLAHELRDARIATLAVADDGTVIVATTRGAHFAMLRGTTGNTSVAARWAAAWDS